MSNLWFNIKFGKRHWQLSRDWDITFCKNPYWNIMPKEYEKVRWFKVYCAFGKHF